MLIEFHRVLRGLCGKNGWVMKQNITTIILVRHGETVANREGIFRGRYDFPLNDVGLRQSKLLADEISGRFSVSAIYSSPLSRATATAEPIALAFGLEMQIEPDFTNISLGNWEGVSHIEIEKQIPDQYRLWLTEPEKLEITDGETLAQVQNRAVSGIDRLVRENEDKTFVVVSHRAVLKPLIAGLIGISEPYFWKIHIDNAAYSVVHHDCRKFSLIQLNCNHYLDEFVYENGG